MSMDSTNRWLILDQGIDRGDWTTEKCDGLIWDEGGLTRELPRPGHGAAEAEICILFLPDSAGGWRLPEQFDNRIVWQWNIWCHYGRDITPGEVPERWRGYERLTDEEKKCLSADDDQPPMPFSRAMPQKWSEEFRELKELVKRNARSDSDARRGDFHRSLALLAKAWGLAGKEKGMQAQILEGKVALPVVLSAQFVLDSLSSSSASPAKLLAAAIKQCRGVGLQAMAPQKEQFSDRVREAYRQFNFTLMRAQLCLKDAEAKLAANTNEDKTLFLATYDVILVPQLEDLKVALTKLIQAAESTAEATTASLKENPRNLTPKD